MKNKKKAIMIGLILMGIFLGGFGRSVEAAPPILSDEDILEAETEETAEEDKDKKEKSKSELKKEKKDKKLKKTLGKMRRRLVKSEKKIRVRANIFRSDYTISDCTGGDKARSRLTDIGDEGGLVIKGNLSISSSNEANIENNEGSINNNTSVNIINEYYKRC